MYSFVPGDDTALLGDEGRSSKPDEFAFAKSSPLNDDLRGRPAEMHVRRNSMERYDFSSPHPVVGLLPRTPQGQEYGAASLVNL